MPFHLGPWEIGLIVLIILLVFGVGKLPQVGGAIGRGIREFRKGQSGSDAVTGVERKKQRHTGSSF
jgi:sec-independent protein translocase protein TatA